MKRIRGKIMGQLVSIAANDWKVLQQRFNPANIEDEQAGTVAAINIKCPLCGLLTEKCAGCTFKKFETLPTRQRRAKVVGCINVVYHTLKRRPMCTLGADSIKWKRADDRGALRDLHLLRAAMDKLEAQND